MNRINWTELKPQIQQVGRLSLPAILTQITTIAMQYIDSAMVGALGANASAAIGLVSSTTWLLSGTIYAVSAGFSVQVAHQIGGNHDKKARDVVRHGIASALVVSAVLCLIGLLISHPLPGWLGARVRVPLAAPRCLKANILIIKGISLYFSKKLSPIYRLKKGYKPHF